MCIGPLECRRVRTLEEMENIMMLAVAKSCKSLFLTVVKPISNNIKWNKETNDIN